MRRKVTKTPKEGGECKGGENLREKKPISSTVVYVLQSCSKKVRKKKFFSDLMGWEGSGFTTEWSGLCGKEVRKKVGDTDTDRERR